MPSIRMRLATAACTLALGCTLVSACEQQGNRLRRRDATVKSSGTVNVRIGLTGLILMVPPKNAAGATELFMPKTANHVAYLGFYQANATGCDQYNVTFKVCFINMEGSWLDPIGRAGASGGRPAIPQTVVNLSNGLGPKVNKSGIDGRIRARASLLSGTGTNPCGLAEWEFDPPGDPPAERLPFTNVLTWTMSALPGDRVELVRRPLRGSSPAERRFVVPARAGRGVELLLLHIPTGEFAALRDATSGSGTVKTPYFDPTAVKKEFDAHLYQIYDMMAAAVGSRPLPTVPLPVQDICPIRVLDLQNAVYPSALQPEGAQIDGQPVQRVKFGVRTFSCVMTSADGS